MLRLINLNFLIPNFKIHKFKVKFIILLFPNKTI